MQKISICFYHFTNVLSYDRFSGDVTEEHNIILETPISNDTLNKSGNDRLYQLEEEPTYTTYKKRKKEEKKAKKKKDKEAKVNFAVSNLQLSF